MSNVYVKKEVRAFNSVEVGKVEQGIARLYGTQHGALMERFTAEELKLLFVKPEHRDALSLVYSLETQWSAKGNIHFDLIMNTGPIEVFQHNAVLEKCNFAFSFNRESDPNGFVTPVRMFGTHAVPVTALQPAPETLRSRFIDSLRYLAINCAEWAVVKWVFQRLNRSLRTPQQMRYVWPAIYPISTAAQLDMNLISPSARAGINAVPGEDARPYMADTNDVVARSALIGINKEYLEKFAANTITVTHQQIRLRDTTIVYNQG